MAYVRFFFRRLRDHPKLSQDALRSQLEVKRMHRYRTVLPAVGDTIATLVEEWASEWLTDTRTDAEVEKRLRLKKLRGGTSFGSHSEDGRLVATVVALSTRTSSCAYGCGSSCIPLVLMLSSAHLVTSALFLLPLVLPSGNSPYPPVPLADRVTLLKAYFATSAAWYISQGNGPILIEEFYVTTNDRLTSPPAVLSGASPA